MKLKNKAALGLFTSSLLLMWTGCTSMRYGQTAMGQAIDSPVTIPFAWGEVFCGRGVVCAEVEVLRVDFDNRKGGRVEVLLHNRTGSSVVVQVSLEMMDASGARLDSSNFQNVALPPRQEKYWEMPGIYQPGAKIRVVLRQAI